MAVFIKQNNVIQPVSIFQKSNNSLISTSMSWKLPIRGTVFGLGSENPSDVTFEVDNDFTAQGLGIREVTFNGDTFVKFPTMYRKINTVVDDQITSFTMANSRIDNTYEPYPCFVAPDNSILPYVLIGKYCYSSTSVASSTTSNPAWIPVRTARTLAQARGTGYQQYDWQLQKLFVDLCLLVSQTVNFNSGAGVQNYLGVYDLASNVWVDGRGEIWGRWGVATDPANYVNEPDSTSQGYTMLSYWVPLTKYDSDRLVVKLGYDPRSPFANFPSAIADNANYATYYCNSHAYNFGRRFFYSNIGSSRADCGLWHTGRTNVEGEENARLCYRPTN